MNLSYLVYMGVAQIVPEADRNPFKSKQVWPARKGAVAVRTSDLGGLLCLKDSF